MSALPARDPAEAPLVSAPPAAVGEPELVLHHEEEKPTASHALAEESIQIAPEEKGASQLDHGDVEVKNLGWNEESRNVPRPLVGGLKNEELWTLIRRFNKQTYMVKSIDVPPMANLDMNIADEEEFSPDKLRSQLERMYIVVVAALFSFWKHIVRLRSWREYKRTSAFLGVYTLAWLLDILVPTIAAWLMVLILHPPARDFCFPPAPAALIDSKTGGVQTPAAGVLASEGSLTGAPEKHEGEAVEQEAHSFVNTLSSLVISTAAGKHPQGDPHEDRIAPDPTEMTEDISSSKVKASGMNPAAEHDRTKEPVAQAVWTRTRPIMHLMADFVDTWERFGNALSPTAPFPRRRPRLILASCLVPVLLGSFFTSSYMVLKGMGFGVGFGFFGDPIITRTLDFVNSNYPGWQKLLELRHSLLRGIPTNAQLTITLLRIGEKNKAPIPPPPSTDVPPPVEAHETAGENLEHLEGATEEEIQDAVHPDSDADQATDEAAERPKKTRRLLNMLKGTAKGGIQTILTADKAKAKVGAKHAKDRLGVVKSEPSQQPAGPVRFPARFKGKKGHAYITATATTPAISWTSDINDVKPAWTVSISDISALTKVGGLGWKSKIVVGWALGHQIVDGLSVTTKSGDEFHLTAVETRDDFFNRLISIGSQMWEVW